MTSLTARSIAFALVATLAAALLLAADAPLDPRSVADAAAKTEAEMKAYDEVISGLNTRFRMVPIRGGVFTMGSPSSEANRKEDEGPQVQVQIEPFWMATHEVRWEEFDTFIYERDIEARERAKAPQTELDKLADAASRPTAPFEPINFNMPTDGHPALSMTHFCAKQYTRWLSLKTGRFYRLPTEAEWEYACRAGMTTAYSFGDDPAGLEEHGWYFDNAKDSSHPSGTKKPNPWGLYDMHGNVHEIVLDAYDEKWYEKLAAKAGGKPVSWKDAINWEPVVFSHVVRGGSWDSDPKDCRSASRLPTDPAWKDRDPQVPRNIWYFTDGKTVGFRVVRPLAEPSEEEKRRYWEADHEEIRRLYNKYLEARAEQGKPSLDKPFPQ